MTVRHRLRTLDAALMSIPAQAQECVFAFLKVPEPTEDFGQEAGMSLGDLGWGRPLVAKIHGKDEHNRMITSLYVDNTSLGEELVRAGLARINRKARVLPHEKELYDGLAQTQEEARKNRVNMWQYGDIESDDESTAASPWGRR